MGISTLLYHHHRSRSPNIDHRLEHGDNTFLPDLEEVAIACNGFEELHHDCSMRICRDAGLHRRGQHLAVGSERTRLIVDLTPLLLRKRRRLHERPATFGPVCQKHMSLPRHPIG
jgi:hypothetical protein